MIGFGHQRTVRRPFYSITGTKIGYLVSGPDGEWWVSVNGKRIGRIKQFKRPTRFKDVDTYLNSSHLIGAAEVWAELGE